MFLTTKGRYAVTAMLDIMLHGGVEKPISLSQISERQGISVSYLEQIFLLLKKHSLVHSVKGPGGGYIISKKPSEISVVEILHAVGESIKMTKCQGTKSCTGASARCITHHLWENFEQKISNYLTSTTMAHILEKNTFSHEDERAVSTFG
jgi:Rrf2 family transcriptional regulator, iron-sulfur cluster assembly transcription factor